MLNNHLQMMKSVIMSPKVFFDGVNEAEGYKKSTIFALINTFVTFVLSALFTLLKSGNNFLLLSIFGAVILVPLMIVFLFIGAAIIHVIAKILGGQGKLVGTYQSVTYATAIGPATAIPFIGMLFSLYQLYLVVVGLRKMHQYSTTKAVISILLPVGVLIIVLILSMIAVAALEGATLFNFFKASGVNPQDLKNLENIKSPQDLEKLYPTFAPNEEGSTAVPDYSYPTGYDNYQDSTDNSPSL